MATTQEASTWEALEAATLELAGILELVPLVELAARSDQYPSASA